MQSLPLLSLAIWLPILFGVAVLVVGSDRNPGTVRTLALLGAVVSFLVTLPLISGYDPSTPAMQFVEQTAWIDRFHITYHLGIDGISLWMVVLTALITVLVVVAGWEVITERVAQYMASFLILSGLMIGVFCAMDGLSLIHI